MALSNLTTIGLSDLASDVLSIRIGTNFSDAPSSPDPGQLYWHRMDSLMYCYHDQVDDTGVSLWLAIGPDRFETACLASEPIPAGAVVQPVVDRWVARHSNSAASNDWLRDGTHMCVVGLNQSTLQEPVYYGGNVAYPTTASGTWFRCAIDGIAYGWISSSNVTANATPVTSDLRPFAPSLAQRGALVLAINTSTNAPVHNPCAMGLVLAPSPASETVGRLFPFLFVGQRNWTAL